MYPFRREIFALLCLATAACGPLDPYENDLPALGWDLPPGFTNATSYGLAHPGRWELPPDTEATGELQNVAYDGAGPWNDGASCAPWLLPGTVTLRDALYGYFPQIFHIGGYNCRKIAGTNSLSQHGTGRALDLHIVLDGAEADNDAGDPVGNWLVENAEAIGIQAVIWDRTIWKSNHTPKAYAYGGVHDHHDHLHIELNVEGANQGTDWFAAPFGPEPCAVIPAAGVTLSEDGACFAAFGPSTYWRSEAGAGHDGDLLWTNAFSAAEPSNWARWSLNFAQAGSHRLEAYVDATWGVYAATRYQVRAAGVEHTVTIDQGASSGWVELGIFAFDAGGGQHLSLYDNYGGTVAGDQHIVADAIRLTPEAQPPCQLLGAQGGVLEETGPCFALHGPAQYWRDESGVGHDGSLLWTNAFENATPSNWAEWAIVTSEAGDYELFAYLDAAFAVHAATRYEVRAAGVDHTVIVDQSAASGWTSLGVFNFAAGGDQRLAVYDNYAGTVPAGQHIVADAIELVRVDAWCGDGTCDGAEDCGACPADCSCGPVCGDGECSGAEGCEGCPADCGACPASCGDGSCDEGESCGDCAADCGACPVVCGDGSCDFEESCGDCPADCGDCPASCGDGSCGFDESCDDCPADCGACVASCGDGSCEASESCGECPADCGACPTSCGDGSCDFDESCGDCPADCGACAGFCGDGICDADEVCADCQVDCGICTEGCGDGFCAASEACGDCAEDCGACDTVGQAGTPADLVVGCNATGGAGLAWAAAASLAALLVWRRRRR